MIEPKVVLETTTTEEEVEGEEGLEDGEAPDDDTEGTDEVSE